MHVERPRIATSFIEAMIGTHLETAQNTLADPSAWRLWNFVRTSRTILDEASVLRKDSRLLEDAARWMARSVALLAAGKAGWAGTLPFGDREVPIPTPDDDAITPWHVADAILASLIARDEHSRAMLGAFDVGLLADSSIETDDLAGVWARTLQGFLQGRSDLSAKPVIDAARPARLSIAEPGLAQLTELDAVALAALARGDVPAFDDALVAAVEAHHAWYKDPPRLHDHTGWVALGPLAMACVAHDRGMEVPVRSEYLPQALIDRQYADAPAEGAG